MFCIKKLQITVSVGIYFALKIYIINQKPNCCSRSSCGLTQTATLRKQLQFTANLKFLSANYLFLTANNMKTNNKAHI